MTISEKEFQSAQYYCNKYLPGAWKIATKNQINVIAVTGGMTNLLYRCQLIDQVTLHSDEPREVLLRLYGPSKGNVDIEIEIFTRLASAGLGPGLYCAFDKGRFEEYLPSNALKNSEMTDPSISRVTAQKIAAVNNLDIEILDKKSNWLIDKLKSYEAFNEIMRYSPFNFAEFVPDHSRWKARDLINIDFKAEITFLEDLFEKTQKEPLVFSHNDLHQNNIILSLDETLSLESRLVLIDFEYCSYNFRTFDVANHLDEWCFDYNNDEYPYFHFSLDRFPSVETQKQFLSDFIDGHKKNQNISKQSSVLSEMNRTNGLSQEEMVEKLFDEMKSCLMASNLLWTMWAIETAITSKIVFGYWEMAQCKWECYLLTKRQFQQHSRKQRHRLDEENLKSKVGRAMM